MQYFALQEKKEHGSLEFPVEYHYVSEEHPRHNMSFHWHKEWELIRIVDGTFQIYIDETMYEAKQGDILLIREGMLHGGTPASCIYECLLFDLHGLFRDVGSIKKYIRPIYKNQYLTQVFYPDHQSDIYPIAEELMAAFSQPDAGLRELVTIVNIGRLFTTILQKKYYTEWDASSPRSSRMTTQVRPILEYIENHYAEHITVADLAALVNMHPKYFNSFFSSILHQTPMEYVNYYRIEQAQSMLSLGDRSILEIGLDCGFCDGSHFVKTFKKYKHMTPKEYRKLNM